MHTFFIRLSVTVSFILITTGALIFCADLDGYFDRSSSQYERFVAHTLAKEVAIIPKAYINDHVVKHFMFNDWDQVEIALTGSSRGLQYDQSMFTGSFANFSVGGGGFFQQISFINQAIAQHNPRQIIVNIDPWLFDTDYEASPSPFQFDDYTKALRLIDQDPTVEELLTQYYRKYRQLISFDYATKAVVKLLNPSRFRSLVEPTQCESHETFLTLCHDGSLRYPVAFATRDDTTVTKIIAQQVTENRFFDNERDYQFSEHRYQQFVSYIQKISTARRVILVVEPFHPLAYEKVKERTPEFFTAQDKLPTSNLGPSVEIIGSFDPKKVNCVASDFFDAVHPKRSCLTKIFASIIK